MHIPRLLVIVNLVKAQNDFKLSLHSNFRNEILPVLILNSIREFVVELFSRMASLLLSLIKLPA